MPGSHPSRVLLIDADPAFSAALAAQPGTGDVRFEHASGSLQALRLLRRGAYDVVLTSPNTPISEDIALVEEMRDAHRALKVIVLAPRAAPHEIVESVRAHVFSCFTFPFDVPEIAGMIQRAIQNPDWKDGIQVISARADWLSMRVSSRRLSAERLVQFLTELANDVPEITRDELVGAFREIALNAMEHGAGFSSDQMIEVSAVRTQRAIVYYVKDPGPGFSIEDLPHAAVSNPADDPLAHTEKRAELGLRPGGFGLLIARKVVDEFLHSEKGNEVLLIKRVG
jgi:anti-sigma regulatory factor (Ser/Thr protein kinase)/CheY-like chemotaxis protein